MLTTIEGIYENGQIILNEKPVVKQTVKVFVTFTEEKVKDNKVKNPSAKLRGAWKNASPEAKEEINTYFDNIRNEWERNI